MCRCLNPLAEIIKGTTSSEKGQGHPSVLARKSLAAYSVCCHARYLGVCVRHDCTSWVSSTQHSYLPCSSKTCYAAHRNALQNPQNWTQPQMQPHIKTPLQKRGAPRPFSPYEDPGDLLPKDRRDVEMVKVSPKEKKRDWAFEKEKGKGGPGWFVVVIASCEHEN